MLLELYIKNIALINALHLSFADGFNVLTGETGAGKSIIIDAVCLVIGGRANKELIRSGTDKATVNAAFSIQENSDALGVLEKFGIDAEDGVITIGREISLNGQNICRICGCPCSLSQLRELAATLIDMHGQHEHQKLLDPAVQLALIDELGGQKHAGLLSAVSKAYDEYSKASKALKEAETSVAERERLSDILHFQLSEIDEVKPKAGEYDRLLAKSKLYEHAELISDKIHTAYAQTYSGGSRSSSACEALKKAANAMEAISEYNERFAKIHKQLEESYFVVQDIGLEIQDIEESLDYDPEKQARIDARLDALQKLMRKYGPGIDDVLAFREEAEKKLQLIEHAEENQAALQKALEETEQIYLHACHKLTESREQNARQLCSDLQRELYDLGMPKLRIEVRFSVKAQYSDNGTDIAAIMISPNPGEPVKPMSAIASGGELSRIMLAVKTIQNQNGGAGTLIFDEIDTGVSGHMAQAVGEKLLRIGLQKQVLCITHLPQIAALGDSQYVVEKKENGDRTTTDVRLLDESGRISELARLVGGNENDESALRHSESLLKQAHLRKKELAGTH